MAASVSLVVRKFVEGNDNYRDALRNLIDAHPDRDIIIQAIEDRGVSFIEEKIEAAASAFISRVHRIQREIDRQGG